MIELGGALLSFHCGIFFMGVCFVCLSVFCLFVCCRFSGGYLHGAKYIHSYSFYVFFWGSNVTLQ